MGCDEENEWIKRVGKDAARARAAIPRALGGTQPPGIYVPDGGPGEPTAEEALAHAIEALERIPIVDAERRAVLAVLRRALGETA